MISGDLTPECTAVVTAVLESLAAPAGAEDTPVPGAALPRRAGGDDASLTPVVTGDVDLAVLDDLVRLCLQLGGHGAQCGPPGGVSASGSGAAGQHGPAPAQGPAAGGPVPPGPFGLSREAIQQAIIGKAADLMSGPGGLASFLRDRKCRWPGGCGQPAAACQAHHVRHLADGGPTSLDSCVLLCSFHHQIVIHRWGWTLVLNPDGTTTATNPDHTKTLHSHSPQPGGGPDLPQVQVGG